ncbi:MAG: hypothetical protein M1830_007180 [Pleopsidium flavum]|nr:MAG: hypothetical protein M1830_007180 [Pleopsidium flavum]
MTESEPSYIDYEAFLDPTFSPTSFANTLVTATNNPSDTTIDLSTPLSRVLFDVQEIDTHIHTLTTKSALPLLTHTKEQTEASQRIVQEVEAQVANLTDGYNRLEKEVIQRYETAEEVRLVVERLWHTVKIGRSVGRCLQLGRQLEAHVAELSASELEKREDHRAMVRGCDALLTFRQLFAASKAGEEGEGLDRVNVITTLRNDLITPVENNIRSRAQQTVREFSMSSLSTSSTSSASPSYAHAEVTKSRATSALISLYLLSPTVSATSAADFQPEFLLAALQAYLQTALMSSLASLARALGTLPTLDRTLLEVSARCQNIVALEALLESIKSPLHPLLAVSSKPSHRLTAAIDGQIEGPPAAPANLLQPSLLSLDTSSLPSYFWRSLASSLSSRVQDIVVRGGVSARTLRSNKDKVRDAIRDCVLRGSQLPMGSISKEKAASTGTWEREAAVMVGSVIGVLGR